MVRAFAWLVLISLLSGGVSAGVLVDFRDRSGKDSQFVSDGGFGRLNLPGDQGYIILDYAAQSMKAVVPARKQVLDMSGDMPSFGGEAPEKTPVTVEPDGDGPEIAGYQTRRYKLLVNGKSCGTVFASQKALEDTGMDQMFRALQKIADQTAKTFAAVKAGMSECQKGMSNTFDHIETIGAPLRSVNNEGKVDVEVTDVKTDVELAADTFAVPSDYRVVSIAGQLKKAEKQLQAKLQTLKDNLPETVRQLEELQKAGKISAEKVEKLKRYLQNYQTSPQ